MLRAAGECVCCCTARRGAPTHSQSRARPARAGMRAGRRRRDGRGPRRRGSGARGPQTSSLSPSGPSLHAAREQGRKAEQATEARTLGDPDEALAWNFDERVEVDREEENVQEHAQPAHEVQHLRRRRCMSVLARRRCVTYHRPSEAAAQQHTRVERQPRQELPHAHARQHEHERSERVCATASAPEADRTSGAGRTGLYQQRLGRAPAVAGRMGRAGGRGEGHSCARRPRPLVDAAGASQGGVRDKPARLAASHAAFARTERSPPCPTISCSGQDFNMARHGVWIMSVLLVLYGCRLMAGMAEY
jgi:hypothetical protein